MDDITILAIGAVIALVIVFLLAKFQDIVWRTKQMRKIMKKNYFLLNIVSTDNKSIAQKMIDIENGLVIWKGKMWIAKKGRIYRKDKQEAGFDVTTAKVGWEEGVPMLFVDENTLKPLDFVREESGAKPMEISAVLNAWVVNQLAKGMGAIKSQQIILIIIVALCGICLLLGYVQLQAIEKMQKDITALSTRIGYGSQAVTQTNTGGTTITQTG